MHSLRAALFALLAATVPAAAGAADTDVEISLDPAAIDAVSLAEITPCNGLLDWSPTLRGPEEAAALAANRDVRRAGRRLRIGRAAFTDIPPPNPDSDEGIKFELVGRYRSLPLKLAAIMRYESFAWSLVDPASGARQDAGGLPLPGPDGHVFTSVTRSNGYDEPSLTLIEWKAGRFTAAEVTGGYVCGLAWQGPDVLTLRLRVGETDDWKPARVVRKAGAWVLEGP